jgi:molecular chaperone GrpE
VNPTPQPEADDERSAPQPAAEPQVAATEAELAAARAEKEQLQDQLMRAMADMQNMRRRQKQELDDARRSAIEGIAVELLPVLDNFGAALAAYGDKSRGADHALIEGVRMVKALLAGALERHGLSEMRAENQPFDPARHEAVAVEVRAGVAPGIVLKVLQAGYLLGNRVVRHAKVLVSAADEPKRS